MRACDSANVKVIYIRCCGWFLISMNLQILLAQTWFIPVLALLATRWSEKLDWFSVGCPEWYHYEDHMESV